MLTEHLTRLADKIISKSQTAFVKGRNILEGVVVLHEVIHELKRSKRKGVIFKIDFEKAYDNIKWSFVQEVLSGKGFPDTGLRKSCRQSKGDKFALMLMDKEQVTSRPIKD